MVDTEFLEQAVAGGKGEVRSSEEELPSFVSVEKTMKRQEDSLEKKEAAGSIIVHQEDGGKKERTEKKVFPGVTENSDEGKELSDESEKNEKLREGEEEIPFRAGNEEKGVASGEGRTATSEQEVSFDTGAEEKAPVDAFGKEEGVLDARTVSYGIFPLQGEPVAKEETEREGAASFDGEAAVLEKNFEEGKGLSSRRDFGELGCQDEIERENMREEASVTEAKKEGTEALQAPVSGQNKEENIIAAEEGSFSIGLAGAAPEVLLTPNIGVVGLGGAGGNAINNMIRAKLNGSSFIVANTDAQALMASLANERIQLGTSLTQGLGAGARPEIGRQAAEESLDKLQEAFENLHMLFITAGMGGGTGTGAAPVIAKLAREMGILTVGVVTKPFHFEGRRRMETAERGIEELSKYVDTLIIVPNQNLFRIAKPSTTFAEAFKMADDVLYQGVRSITDLMLAPGLINLDFADVRTVMSQMGRAMMGSGEAEGENRALNAAEKAIANPLLDDSSMKGSKGVLINISGGADLSLMEVDEAAERIRDEVDPDANIIFGACCDESLTGKIRVSIVATGINSSEGEGDNEKGPSYYRITPQTGTFGSPSVRPVISENVGTGSSGNETAQGDKHFSRELPSFNLTPPVKEKEGKESPFGFPAREIKKDGESDRKDEESGISVIPDSMMESPFFSLRRGGKPVSGESAEEDASETIITISEEDEPESSAQKNDGLSGFSGRTEDLTRKEEPFKPDQSGMKKVVKADSEKPSMAEKEPPLPEIFQSSVRSEFRSEAVVKSDEPMRIELPAEESLREIEKTAAQDSFIPQEPVIIPKSLEQEETLSEEPSIRLPEISEEEKPAPVSSKPKSFLFDFMGIGGKSSSKEEAALHIRHEGKEGPVPVVSEEQLEIPAFFRRQS